MKIIFFIDNLGSGGSQNQFVLLATALLKKGYQVSFFTYFSDDFFLSKLKTHNIDVHTSLKKDKLGLNVIFDFARLCNEKKPDIVISRLPTPNFYAACAKKLSTHTFKLIATHGSSTVYKSLSFIQKSTFRFSNHTADVMICNSYHERDNLQAIFPKLKNKIHTVYNLIDFSRFPFKPSEKLTRKVLVVASVSKYKRGLDIIESLHLVKEKEKLDFTLTWIGRKQYYKADTDNYFYKMSDKIKLYALENAWEWQEPNLEIEKEYNKYDALILASDIEGLPNVVSEAMSCGLPILISNTLDHGHLIDDTVGGFLFEINDPKSLADALIALYQLSFEDIKTMGQKSSERVRCLFNNEENINHYVKHF